MTKIRWAIVGTSGFALDWLGRGIKLGSNSELVAVVSRDAERGKTAAQKLVSIGESPRPPGLDVSELAAWTTIGNVLLNLDETISKG